MSQLVIQKEAFGREKRGHALSKQRREREMHQGLCGERDIVLAMGSRNPPAV